MQAFSKINFKHQKFSSQSSITIEIDSYRMTPGFAGRHSVRIYFTIKSS